MSDKHTNDGTTALDSSLAATKGKHTNQVSGDAGSIRRYRLPLFLAGVAVCLYAGSVLYVIFVRGQLA